MLLDLRLSLVFFKLNGFFFLVMIFLLPRPLESAPPGIRKKIALQQKLSWGVEVGGGGNRSSLLFLPSPPPPPLPPYFIFASTKGCGQYSRRSIFGHDFFLVSFVVVLFVGQHDTFLTHDQVINEVTGDPQLILLSPWAHSLSVATLVVVSDGVDVWGCSKVFTSLICHLRSVSTPRQLLQ